MHILHFCTCSLVEILWLQVEIPVHHLLLRPRNLKMLQEKCSFSLKMHHKLGTENAFYLWKRHF